VRVSLLGPVAVQSPLGLVAVKGERLCTLLALLAIASPSLVPNGQLLREIWQDQWPSKADNALHALMSRLRRDLDGACGRGFANARMVTGRPGYGLRLAENEVDARLFDRLCTEARAESGERALELYRRALSLWRGPALGEVTGSPQLLSVRARLEESRLAAYSEKLDLELGLGRHGRVLGELQELTTLHPVHEGFARQLMIAFYRAGRQADALAAYGRVRRALRETQGIEPSPLLQECLAAVLRHDIPAAAAELQSAGAA